MVQAFLLRSFSLHVQSILPPYRADHFKSGRRRGKKARVNAATPPPTTASRKKTLTPSVPPVRSLTRTVSVSDTSSAYLPPPHPCRRPPAASPLQYLRACKPTSDFHLSRFASPGIRDVSSARALCSVLECQREGRRATRPRNEEEIRVATIVPFD